MCQGEMLTMREKLWFMWPKATARDLQKPSTLQLRRWLLFILILCQYRQFTKCFGSFALYAAAAGGAKGGGDRNGRVNVASRASSRFKQAWKMSGTGSTAGQLNCDMRWWWRQQRWTAVRPLDPWSWGPSWEYHPVNTTHALLSTADNRGRYDESALLIPSCVCACACAFNRSNPLRGRWKRRCMSKACYPTSEL